MATNSGQRTVKSVENACELLSVLHEGQSATVSEVSKRVDLSVGTVHTHLATLKEAGYVVQNGTQYELGPALLTLGEHVRNNHELYQASNEQVDSLAEEIDECAHLLIEHDGRVVTLYESFGTNAVGTEYHTRKRAEALQHLHCTASGKAMLSQLSRDRIESILDEHGMVEKTRHTITDRETLLEELATIQERTYAIADEEQIAGIRAVGAPITSADGELYGAISVSGPVSRLPDSRLHDEIADRVVRATNIAEVNLNTSIQGL